MKKSISLYICLFLICFPTVSFSQEEPKAEPKKVTVEVLDNNLIKWDNIKYVLLEEVSARKILQKVEDYPKLELKIKKLTELSVLYMEQIELSTKVNANLQEQTGLLTEEAATLQKQLDEGTSWWKHPILWCAIGIVVGTGLTIAIFKIAKEI